MTDERAPLRKGICAGCGEAKWLYAEKGHCNNCRVFGAPLRNTPWGKEWTAQSDSANADVGNIPSADPHDACNETIRAREREARDLRYRTQGLEHRVAQLESQLEGSERLVAALRTERNEWKASAEKVELEYQDALQDGSICPDPDLHKGDTLDGWAAEEIGRLHEENADLQATVNILREQKRYMADVRKERDNLKRENNALQDAVKHLRGQIDDGSSSATHWCCYHNRWERSNGTSDYRQARGVLKEVQE